MVPLSGMPERPVPDPAVEPRTARLIGTALALGLVAAGLAMTFFLWLADEVLEGETGRLDQLLRSELHGAARPLLTQIMVTASVLGAPVVLAGLGLIAAGVFLTRHWRRAALFLLIIMAGAGLLNAVLKHFYARARPTAFFDFYPVPSSYSFPSGHTLFATCFFGGVAVLASHRLDAPWARLTVWLLAFLAVAVIGLSRVYLGVHYPSDVIGGFAAGVVWVATVALGDRLAERRRSRNH
jgi:membrane-associated phospholipid phosphatase